MSSKSATMLMLYAILLASAGISSMAEASAIKGHARAHDELARSIKLAPAADNSDRASAKSVQAPILESSKRIYNDESIRRLALAQPEIVKQQQQIEQAAPIAPVAVVPAAPVVPVVAEPIRPVEAVVAKSAVEAEKVVEAKEVPVVAAAPVAIAPVVVPVAPVAAEPKVAPVKVVEADKLEAKKVVGEPVAKKEDEIKSVSSYSAQEELQAKKEEAPVAVDPLHIEVPAPDPGLVLSEPIDSTTKLLIDLDEHVQKFLPAEEQSQPLQPPKEPALVAGVDYSPPAVVVASAAASSPVEATGKSSGPLVPYSSVEEPIVPPLPSLEGVEKASAGAPAIVAAAPVNPIAAPAAPASSSAVSSSSVSVPSSATRQAGHQNQNQQQVITQLLDQLDSLQNRIQDTINQLVARRRYVMSALLRPMGTYVRRVRTNLERLQNRVNQLQAAAVSVGGGNSRPGGFVDAAAIETIRRRIDDISKRISDIVNRIRFSLTPTSAPLNSNGRK